jgi:hypothetical protein
LLFVVCCLVFVVCCLLFEILALLNVYIYIYICMYDVCCVHEDLDTERIVTVSYFIWP